jgi:rhamnulokinase
MVKAVAAVDLGASSGRVMLGHVGRNELRLTPVARFANQPVRIFDGLHWNILELYSSVVAGLGAVVREDSSVASVAVDSWATDYALMRGGQMLGTPYHYRDERNFSAVEATHALVGPAALYAANGLQFLSFNTLYQLAADRAVGTLDLAEGFLLIPDLFNYWLTGRQFAEQTNASTTGLLSVTTGEWDRTLIGQLELPQSVFPELVAPGTVLGALCPEVDVDSSMVVTTVGSHDTASAIVAVPATIADFAYI